MRRSKLPSLPVMLAPQLPNKDDFDDALNGAAGAGSAARANDGAAGVRAAGGAANDAAGCRVDANFFDEDDAAFRRHSANA